MLWFSEKNVSNKYILGKWKKKLIVFPRHILEPIYIFFSFFKFRKLNLFCLRKKSEGSNKIFARKKIDDADLLQKYNPFINFTKQEIYGAKQFLNEFNISKI